MQYFLGTSKNNPIFYVKYTEQEQMIDIFFGGIKFTSIPNDKRSILFKSTISMLVNAEVCIRHIQIAFKISFQTVQKFTAAFKDATTEVNLRNPGRIPYKLNEKVKNSIFNIAKEEKNIGVRGYQKRTNARIRELYGFDISHETIRAVVKEKFKTENIEESKLISPDNNETVSLQQLQGRNTAALHSILNGKKIRNNYAGVYLLTPYLSHVFNEFPSLKTGTHSVKSIFLWWMLGLFLGAINLEGLRYLHIEDFEFISGYDNFPCVKVMRSLLHDPVIFFNQY